MSCDSILASLALLLAAPGRCRVEVELLGCAAASAGNQGVVARLRERSFEKQLTWSPGVVDNV